MEVSSLSDVDNDACMDDTDHSMVEGKDDGGSCLCCCCSSPSGCLKSSLKDIPPSGITFGPAKPTSVVVTSSSLSREPRQRYLHINSNITGVNGINSQY
jgi:hypothetical protein